MEKTCFPSESPEASRVYLCKQPPTKTLHSVSHMGIPGQGRCTRVTAMCLLKKGLCLLLGEQMGRPSWTSPENT